MTFIIILIFLNSFFLKVFFNKQHYENQKNTEIYGNLNSFLTEEGTSNMTKHLLVPLLRQSELITPALNKPVYVSVMMMLISFH